jgi:hypothetical protein
MTLKRGQAALEFLMTYGWAFLVMIAVIAGIVALDPLGAAQTNINTCQMGGPISCDGDAMILGVSDNNLTVQIENSGRETITISALNLTNAGGSGDSEWTQGSLEIEPNEVKTIDWSGNSGNGPNATISGSLVPGDQYTFDIDGLYYSTRAGSDYERPLEGQIRTVAAQ